MLGECFLQHCLSPALAMLRNTPLESPAESYDSAQYRGNSHQPVTPDDVYHEHVQRDPEICNTCFSHVRDIVLPHSYRRTLKPALVRYYVSRGDVTNRELGAADVAEHPPRSCRCGELDVQLRPLTKRDALAAARELSHRLTEKGHRHDPLLLQLIVARRKRIPTYATQDDETFRLAVDRSLARTSYDYRDLLVNDKTPPQLPPADAHD